MRVVAAVALVAAFVVSPALAQQKSIPKYGEEDKAKTPEQKRQEREAEEAYKRSLGNIPAQKAVDPWGNVRSDNTAKPDANSSAKKTKTGTSAN